MEKNHHLPLYVTKSAKARIPFHLFAVSLFVGVCFIFVYRVSNIPSEEEAGRWAWIGLFLSELWFCLYWFITVIVRWNPIYRCTFKDRLSLRYEEALPGIDIFVCTADPMIEPPAMVINTVLSVMAYDYPPQKLNVYLSDDGGSDLTFYAMVEASSFSKIWLPFCKKFKIEPRSPEAYFRTAVEPLEDNVMAKEWSSIKKSYEGMKKRIETTTKLGRISEEIRKQHKGFREWNLVASRRDHQTILQMLIDGKDPKAVDIEGQPLPTLVYLAREKRPQYHHNFKAGAVNALIRVSSRISNGPIILILDCDMYSNNSESVRDAVCFYMDEEKGHEVGFVQFPQSFENLTKNDVYASSLNVIMGAEIPGFDGNGGPCFIGTGCFHRRNTLCGQKYSDQECKANWKGRDDIKIEESASHVLEDTSKVLASCTYEEKYTQWGNEVGLKYGCPVEDVLSGLAIHCRGWRSIYFNPERKGFLGLPPTTLLQSLVQHKRWSEGDFQIFASRYCPFVYGYKKIPLKLQLSYCIYLLWAPNGFATLYYVAVPSLCLLRGISLFPKISSAWVLPFAFVIIFHRAYSLGEFIWFGGTVQGWWNDQRMWLFRRISSFIFGFLDYILKLVGFSKSAFVVTQKVADDDVSERYEQELMEFGASSPMFTIIATLALLNAFCLVGGMKRVIYMMDFYISAMRRASTLASSVLSRTLATTHGGVNSAAVNHRLLQVALFGSTGGSYARGRWFNSFTGSTARSVSVGVAGALLSVAAAATSLSQEVHAKEPPPAELVPKDVILYQYEACPFCNKVRAFLDYYDIPYKVVEVNPISKKEIKWSDYKKVPILMVDGEPLTDSSDIIDKLGHRIHPEKRAVSDMDDDEETKWRRWVDSHLVHILSPNIYRNTSEALESFDYITSNGNFGFTERITAKYAGAAAMYFVSKKLKKKYNITDERAALYEAAETWVDALNGRDFLGGFKPNLADLAVFGVLRPIRNLRSGKDMVEHTRIGDWYSRMESSVGESRRIKV